jgi:FixJ family two-component response regulator
MKCSVDGCEKPVAKYSGARRLCSTHDARRAQGRPLEPKGRLENARSRFSDWELDLMRDEVRVATLEGYSTRSIAERLDVTATTVERWRKKLLAEGRLPSTYERRQEW